MKKLLLYSLLVLLLSCTNDDDITTIAQDENVQLSNFSIISFDDEAFYEYQFETSSQQGIDINLTTQEGINRQTFLIHRNESVFGFYNQGNALIKDFSTEELRFVDDFGGQPGEERIAARNDNQTLAVLYTIEGTNEYYVRVIDVAQTTQFDIALGTLSVTAQLYVQGNTVYVVHNEDNQSTLFKIDKALQSLEEELLLDTPISGLVFTDTASILLFDFSGNYLEYAIDDLEFIREGTSSFVPDNSVTAKYRNATIYSQFQYPQPNFFAIGPAAYNLNAGNESFLDVASIFNDYIGENTDTSTIQPVHFDYDVVNNVWIVAFTAEETSGTPRFGYFVINETGQILSENVLPRLPWTVIVHN